MPDKKPKEIRLPSVDAEYTYLRRLVCDRCGGPTSHIRHGASGPQGAKMIDHWEVACNNCGASWKLDLVVPAPDFLRRLQRDR